MAVVTDILTEDASGDLMVSRQGDLMIGDATLLHQRDLIMASEGEYKQNPMVGIGVVNFLDDEEPDDLKRKIRSQFTTDGMNVKSVSMVNGLIETDAAYV